jgi:hypothetical protein
MAKAELYNRYPISSVFIYNASTILHFAIGGLILCYTNRFVGSLGIVFGLLYFLFAFVEMYVTMPLQVCKNCVYFKLAGGLCISGLNVIAKKIARPGKPSDFPKRAAGPLSPNNIYIFNLAFPILCGIPILIFNFSYPLLFLEVFLVALLTVRFFFIIPQLACLHCQSKFVCPQAGQMGVREK